MQIFDLYLFKFFPGCLVKEHKEKRVLGTVQVGETGPKVIGFVQNIKISINFVCHMPSIVSLFTISFKQHFLRNCQVNYKQFCKNDRGGSTIPLQSLLAMATNRKNLKNLLDRNHKVQSLDICNVQFSILQQILQEVLCQ